MLPRQPNAQPLPPPPGIIGSLRSGFDAIAGHIGLILLPLGLDLLLWLGPRISVSRMMQPLLDEMRQIAPGSGLPQADIESMMTLYREALQRLNLLAALRTIPVGVFSLMSGRMPIQSPLGAPSVLQVESLPQLAGVLLAVTIFGWALGGLYFQRVAGLVASRSPAPTAPSLPAGRAILQTILYSLICLLLMWSIGLPALFLVYLGFAINSVL